MKHFTARGNCRWGSCYFGKSLIGEIPVGEISGWGNCYWGSCDWESCVGEMTKYQFFGQFRVSLKTIIHVSDNIESTS